MKRERILGVFLAAAAGLCCLGALDLKSVDPQENLRVQRTHFFIHKTHAAPAYDMVVVGDSRALRGISPAELAEANPGLRAFNFAFDAGGFNSEIFAAAEALLDPESSNPTILIATTPLGFIPWKQNNAQYREYARKSVDEVFLYGPGYRLAQFFRPLPPTLPFRRMFGLVPSHRLTEDFQQNGWIATNQEPFNRYEDLSLLAEQLSGNLADPQVVAGLMAQIESWSARGIRVVGTAVPAYAARLAMEDSILQFNRNEYIAEFEQAGGYFADLHDATLQTYDGSHLIEESARQFSRELGRSISEFFAVD